MLSSFSIARVTLQSLFMSDDPFDPVSLAGQGLSGFTLSKHSARLGDWPWLHGY